MQIFIRPTCFRGQDKGNGLKTKLEGTRKETKIVGNSVNPLRTILNVAPPNGGFGHAEMCRRQGNCEIRRTITANCKRIFGSHSFATSLLHPICRHLKARLVEPLLLFMKVRPPFRRTSISVGHVMVDRSMRCR